jgi:hypothetical protein
VKEDPAKKLWRPLKAWHPHEWAPFKEAWQRVEVSVGGALWLTQRDLRQAFLDGQLIAAVRRIRPNGKETRNILEPAFWRRLKINYAWSITGWEAIPRWEAEARKGERLALVVRRRELDKHYPDAVNATTPIERQPDDEQPPTSEHRADAPSRDGERPRRRPGRQPKHDWPKHVTHEVIRRLRAGEKEPTAPEMLQFCEDKWGWQPDIRQMQMLLRDLLL